jgi:hypothetical protein
MRKFSKLLKETLGIGVIRLALIGASIAVVMCTGKIWLAYLVNLATKILN